MPSRETIETPVVTTEASGRGVFSRSGWKAAGRAVLAWVLTGLFVAAVLLGSAPSSGPLWVAVWRQEVEAALRDPWISGMSLVCLLLYAAGLAWLRSRGRAAGFLERLRLGALVFAVAAVVIAWFARGRVFDQYSVLLGFGVVAGLGMGLWQGSAAERRSVRGTPPSGSETLPKLAGEDACATVPCATPVRLFAFWVVVLLTASVFVRREAGVEFFYRGVSRWTGIWNNPNVFGVMMAMGVVLSLGGIAGWWRAVPGTLAGRWIWRAHALVCGLCLPVLAWGLLRSYSRGAWLGLVVALAWQYYWCRSAENSPAPKPGSQGKRSLGERLRPFAVPVLVLSLLILAFWTWRTTEVAPVRRAFSAANPNDFSWRNRTAAWLGAMQILADHPWTGAGWSRVEPLYDAHYRPSQVPEGGALQTNDYLLMGAAMGLPTLAALGVYFWITLGVAARRSAGNAADASGWCRAAAVGLLVSAWFDGGLLGWPGGVLGWVLLEMSAGRGGGCSIDLAARRCLDSQGARPHGATALHGSGPHRAIPALQQQEQRGRAPDRVIIGLAVLAGLAAVFVSAVQIGLPRLPATHRTQAWARQVLIQPGERADFDYLCKEVDWTGERLNALLDHLRLARYNRELSEWKVSEPLFRAFVLSPKIEGTPPLAYDWRRTLWEHCRPRIRKETSPGEAAAILAGFLRSRVTVSAGASSPIGPGAALDRPVVTPADFEWLYVAALRASGIPARMGPERKAEFWSGEQWKVAPRPLAERL